MRMWSFRLLILSVFFVVLATTPMKSAPANVALPSEQRQFCSLVTEYRQLQQHYTQETNPIRKAAMRAPNPISYENRVKALFPENKFTNWVGTVRFSVISNSVSISFLPECSEAPGAIQFGNATRAPGLPIEDSRTIVALDSSVASVLRTASSANPAALVSGELVPFSTLTRLNTLLAGNHGGYAPQRGNYKSRSNPMGASIAFPNYLTKFSSISLMSRR